MERVVVTLNKRMLAMALLLTANFCTASPDISLSGTASVQQRYFTQSPAYPEQTTGQLSFALSPKFETNIGDQGMFTFEPFARADQRDDERTHFDVREALFSMYLDNWEIRAGIGKVFWGQTESIHLVDIVNQTDFVESIDAEEKLGQPMLDVRYLLETGYISAYVLPYFRERTFPGSDGRLRGPLLIDTDNPLFESEDEDNNVDFAFRWQQSIGDLEIGLSYFDGTDRLPDFRPELNEENGDISLRPFYPQLRQVGIDALYVLGGFLWKLEALQGERLDEDFSAAVVGFEYTIVDAFDSGYDLGVLSEYQYDEREDNPYIFGQNDVMFGARLNFNDFAGSEILIGFVQDLDESSSYSGLIEASTRLNANWTLEFNGYFFSSDSTDDPLFFIRKDDHISLELAYYF